MPLQIQVTLHEKTTSARLEMGHAKLCMQGWQGKRRLYSYFVAALATNTVTAAMSMAKSYCRQTACIAGGLPVIMGE